MTGFLIGVVRWVLVPLVMAIGLFLATGIARRTSDVGGRVAAYAGLLAGLVAGSTLAIVQIASAARHADGDDTGFRFNVLAVALGLVIGLALPVVLLRTTAALRLTGVVTLILSSASSLALLNYLFNGAARDFTMLLSMCLLFGILVYLVFNGDKYPELRALIAVRTPRGTDPGDGTPSGGYG